MTAVLQILVPAIFLGGSRLGWFFVFGCFWLAMGALAFKIWNQSLRLNGTLYMQHISAALTVIQAIYVTVNILSHANEAKEF